MDSLLSRYFTTDNPSQAYPATTPSRAGLPDQQLLFDRLLQLAQIDGEWLGTIPGRCRRELM